MTARPFFLICNDDGVHAPGIKALAEAIEPLGDYLIVAPHIERSGSGMALSLTQPLRVEKLAANIYALEGTPTDCVMFAFAKLLPRPPDFVLSGINRGSNIGQDTLYSGTVAAAMEGALRGVPSLAFSLRGKKHYELHHYSECIDIVRMLMKNEEMLASIKGGVLNVNIPDVPLAQMRGFAVCRLGRRSYEGNFLEHTDPRGRPYFWLGGGGDEFANIPESDCKLLYDNYVTLTVLTPDRVHDAANEALKAKSLASLSSMLAGKDRPKGTAGS